MAYADVKHIEKLAEMVGTKLGVKVSLQHGSPSAGRSWRLFTEDGRALVNTEGMLGGNKKVAAHTLIAYLNGIDEGKEVTYTEVFNGTA